MRFSLFLFALGAFAIAPTATAQTGFMPYVGYNLEDEDAVVGVGARFGLPLAVPIALVAQPSAEYQFAGDGIDQFQIDANVIAEFTGSRALAPYAGVGVGFTFVDTEFTETTTEIGLNALGGVVLNPSGFGRPFVQARYSTRGEFQDALTIQGGVILGI